MQWEMQRHDCDEGAMLMTEPVFALIHTPVTYHFVCVPFFFTLCLFMCCVSYSNFLTILPCVFYVHASSPS